MTCCSRTEARQRVHSDPAHLTDLPTRLGSLLFSRRATSGCSPLLGLPAAPQMLSRASPRLPELKESGWSRAVRRELLQSTPLPQARSRPPEAACSAVGNASATGALATDGAASGAEIAATDGAASGEGTAANDGAASGEGAAANDGEISGPAHSRPMAPPPEKALPQLTARLPPQAHSQPMAPPPEKALPQLTARLPPQAHSQPMAPLPERGLPQRKARLRLEVRSQRRARRRYRRPAKRSRREHRRPP